MAAIETRETIVTTMSTGCRNAIMAGARKLCDRRKHPRDQWQDRKGDAPLSHLPVLLATHLGQPSAVIGRRNSLHWVMDMIFRDDECRFAKDHAPATSSTSSTWPTIHQEAKGKHSLCAPAERSQAWNDDFLAGLIAA